MLAHEPRAESTALMAFDRAREAVVAACAVLPSERLALADAAGRVLAERLIAEADLIPFARSAMDGYAVTAADLSHAPVRLALGEPIYAGAAERRHAAGTATPIATGAALPHGSDAVVPFEEVVLEADGVRFARPVAPGDRVFPPGEDALAGDELARPGEQLRPATLAVLAAAGIASVHVTRRPRVAVFSTGDELVPLERAPQRGQVRDSNGILATALLRELGAEVISFEHAGDTRGALRSCLERTLGDVDLIVTTGGASVGPRDYVKSVLCEVGCVFSFETVALRPAKPAAFAVHPGGARVAVLPGNPAAAFVGLHAFVAPALRRMLGSGQPLLPRVTARLDGRVRAKPGRIFAAFAALRFEGDALVATLLDNQCSSLTRTPAAAAGLAFVPPGDQTLVSGDRIAVEVIDWSLVAA